MSKLTPSKFFFALVLCTCCFAFSVTSALAQSQASTGQIVGTVKDPQGAAVPNATVTVTNTATGLTQTLTTNADGLFRAVLLPVGDYTVKVVSQGFGEFTQSGYKVEVGSTLDANVTLQVNAVNEVVTVTAASVETTAVQSTSTVNSTAITELPINGRRFQDFVALTPTADVDPSRNQITLVGQRGINTNIQIDGADYSNPFFGGIRGGERATFAPTVPQEAVREFQVVTSGFNAEFGRSTGGFVNAVTKSGDNNWRGSGFFLGRPEEWAHRNAFGQIASPTQNQYGGSFGGPIIKNKVFLFISAEQQLFKQNREVLFDRIRNTTQLNVSAAELTALGVADSLNFYRSLEGPYEQTNNGTTALGRLDFTFSDRYTANVRYNYSFNKAKNAVTAGTQLQPTTNSALSNNGTEGNSQNTVVGQFNSFFRPTVVMETRAQYSRENRPRTPNAIAPLVDNPIGNFGTVTFLPTTQYDYRVQIANNLTWNKGNHSFKFGGDYNYTFADQFFAFRQTGNISYLNFATTAAGIVDVLRVATPGVATTAFPGLTVADPANRFDDTRLQLRRNVGNGLAQLDSTEFAVFGQDAWKVASNLTLSYGLRWEAQYMPEPEVTNTALMNVVTSARLPLIGGRSINPAVIPDQTDQWAPRLGIAWDPFRDGKTVVRAGAGLFYARTPLLTLAGPMNNFRATPGDVTVAVAGFNAPTRAGTICATLSSPQCPNTVYKMYNSIGINLNNFTLDKLPVLTVDQFNQIRQNIAVARGESINPFDGLQLITAGEGLRNPRSLQVNFGIEREVRNGLTLGFTMDHVNTVYLNRNRDYNLAPPTISPTDRSRRPVYNVNARPIPQLGRTGYIQVRESSARSLFQAATLRAVWRGKWGQFDTNYVLSRTLDDDSTERNATFAEYEDTYNLRPEYNFSRQDRRHRMNFNAVFNMPWGFQFSTLGRFVSGQPINVATTQDLNTDLGNNFTDRPYIAPGVPLKRNAYRNYGTKNIDLRLQRDFRIGERFRFSPSFEMFNAFKFKNVVLDGNNIFNWGNGGINPTTGDSLAPSNPNFLQSRDSAGNYLLSNRPGVPLAMQWGLRMNF
jgi:hypothetical protein